MNIGITGSDGLIGWHLRCQLLSRQHTNIVACGRAEFLESELLDRFVNQCDVIVHLAGANRGADEEVEATNVSLAHTLADSLSRSGRTPHLLFASSIHVDRDTAYGRSKARATTILSDWAESAGARFTSLVLPHVFGEHGRPFYNSVVSTFCFQIANAEEPTIDHDGELELLHTSEVSQLFIEALETGATGEIRPKGRKIVVSEMLAQLKALAQSYRDGVIPPFADQFRLNLFNVYRSYLYPGFYPRALTRHTDQRGWLFEAVKSEHGGQAFFSSTVPGVTRGNHFHHHKVERFLVVSGQAEIRLRRLFDEQVVRFSVSGEQPVFIDMPTLHTHSITNVGKGELLTFFWSHEIFNPEQPDTWAEPVIHGG